MCKAEQLVGRLSPSERRSLRLMEEGEDGRRVPATHEARLIDLGLAELVCGGAELTATGRRALAMIGGWAH